MIFGRGIHKIHVLALVVSFFALLVSEIVFFYYIINFQEFDWRRNINMTWRTATLPVAFVGIPVYWLVTYLFPDSKYEIYDRDDQEK